MGMAFVVPFFFLVCLFLWHSPAYAAPKSYVVYLGSHSHGPEPTVKDFKRATERHHEFLGSFLGSKEKAKEAIGFSYRKHINGFTAELEEAVANEISKHPDVVSLFPNKPTKFQTTRSWYFLGMEDKNGDVPDESIWAKSNFGEDVIIGVIDSGVYPESPSFNDEGMGPVPSRWKGFCQKEEKNGVPCNRKLIGARFFNKSSQLDESIHVSARDYDGHGTHVLSTAGGRHVSGANFFGYANGTAKGGAPNARLASYNSLASYDGEVIASFDAAIHDGVDVIVTSMAGYNSYNLLTDGLSIGAFHAVNKGIVVTCAAGNRGPRRGSVENVVPWVLTVGASSLDRDFYNYITLGNNMNIRGRSLSTDTLPQHKYYPLIDGRDARVPDATIEEASYCVDGSLDPEKVKGKVVVCYPREFSTGSIVRLAGGVGMIFISPPKWPSVNPTYPHTLPATWLTPSQGLAVYSYLNSTKSPVVSIGKVFETESVKPAPRVAHFSSRGPNKLTNLLLKPDVIAPGFNILAAFSLNAPLQYDTLDPRRVLYYIDEGTSMASPHAGGLAALLKALHRDWSPAAIKSAIMTTAFTRDNLGEPMKDFNSTEATPFAYGSGHIQPNRAMDPGLVYDLSTRDYLNYLCALGFNYTQIKIYEPYSCPPIELHNLNYPSISVKNVSKSITVTRTLKNVGTPGTYKARVQSPPGVSVVVNPQILHFQQIGEEKSFQVTLKPKKAYGQLHKDFVFGRLIWSDGNHYVGSPIVVKV